MRRLLAALVVTLALTACHPRQVRPPWAPTCEEDEPCWDCSTMGNLICGPEKV